MAPAVGGAVGELLSDRYAKILACGLLVLALPWLLSNRSRPLLPIWRFSPNASILTTDRVSEYFANRPSLETQYLEAVEVLNQTPCRAIGLVSGGDDWEYPLWVLLHETGAQFTIAHIDVTDVPLIEAEYPVSDDICAFVYLGGGKEKIGERGGEVDIYEWDYLTVVVLRNSH